jgi:predicted membrane-bound spermidine synthase
MSDRLDTSHSGEPLHAAEIAWLTPVFLLSGAAALIYQVAWERVLYSIFGVNSEAITVLVTAFLLGLGIGSLTGGWISKRPGCAHLSWFAAAELSVGAFGAISIPFYHAVGNATLAMTRTSTAFITFLLVLAPTLLMGATLPLLVTYAVRITKSVGWSVGTLYHVNTAGSAIAAILAVTVLLPYAGLQRSVWLAVCCNIVVAVAALRHHRSERRSEAQTRDTLVSVQHA